MKSFIHAPLFKSAIAFLIGIALAAKLGLYAYASGILLLILMAYRLMSKGSPFYKNRIEGLVLIVVFALLGSLFQDARNQNEHNEGLAELECQRVMLRGVVDRAPKETPYGRYTWLRVDLAKLDSTLLNVSGRCVAYLGQDDNMAFEEGDTLLVQADLKPVDSRNAGYLEYLHSQHIFHAAYVKKVRVLRNEHTTWSATIDQYRNHIATKLGMAMADSVKAGIAQAMFLGDKSGLSPESKQAFAQSGLSHILAVSGLHVGVIFMGLGFLFHLISRLPGGKRWKQLCILLGLLGYMFLAGAGAAVVRAVMMFGLVLVLRLIGKRSHLLNVLAFSAWVQMLWNPGVIFDVGFQLSYSAVLGIFWLLPLLEKQWPANVPVWLKHLYSGFGVTIAATIFTTPFVLFYFGTFPTWFLISNVLVSFLAFPLILTGFIMVVLAIVSPWSAPVMWMGELSSHLIGWLEAWVEVMNALPFAKLTLDTLSPVHGWIIGGQLLLAFALFKLPGWIRNGKIAWPRLTISKLLWHMP
ncbi:MAG: ComEC family competence protein [Bacteroidia bacterium]|nr:ComEC family competence protein [Bacteroidia bacterium]